MLGRIAKNIIEEINNTFRVLLVTGPRQVGKTTLLKFCMSEQMSYISLDDTFYRNQAISDPKMFLEIHKPPLMIDEVQYAPQLFPYIKMIVDEKKERGMYWLTGSQQFELMKNVQESLAGRVGIVNLNSLSYAEIKKNANKQLFNPENLSQKKDIDVFNLFEIIFNGGMPELYDIEGMSRNLYFEGYVNTYIARDIKEIINVRNIELFKRFMSAVALHNGEQLNYSSIASALKIDEKTVRAWLDVLVASRIIYLLSPYYNSKLKRLTHMPKIIFMDSGLASFLADVESADSLLKSEKSGHYLETFVISEIVKTYNAYGLSIDLSYYRDKDGKEIDLIMNLHNKLHLFEIKKTKSPNVEMMKNFKYMNLDENEMGISGVISLHEYLTKVDEKKYYIPLSSVIM